MLRNNEVDNVRSTATETKLVEGQMTNPNTIVGTTALTLSAVPESPEPAVVTSPTSPSSSLLSHAASEPTFDVQMRTQQQQKIKLYHDAKQHAVWRTDSLASNSSNSSAKAGAATDYVSMRSTAPACLLQRKSSDSSVVSSSMPRRVSFPESDKELVTGYLEPANPWEEAWQVKSPSEITELYEKSCRKHNTQPLLSILEHLKVLDLKQGRQLLLSLKALPLTPNDCEPLEEIFKRIQYKTIDLSECPLTESCLGALFQMIEYYEAANELDISYNKAEMSLRGWSLCTYMIERSLELQMLNAEGNQISKLGAESLGNALATSNLHTLKLEHCGLKGPPLTSLCCKLYHNKVLKELWLGYNDLDCTDAQHIADMLRFNHSIELIDISNNNIRDEGTMYLVQALILQSTELERRSGLPLQRARAIEDDECVSPLETTPPVQLKRGPSEEECPKVPEIEVLTDQASQSASASISAAVAAAGGSGDGSTSIEEVEKQQKQNQQQQQVSDDQKQQQPAVMDTSAAPTPLDLENDVDDDNTDDTVRTVRGCNQGAAGQSMLDKLLSMNSDSSSEEAPSNISTDTLAACCSEDISENSNEIYDAKATQVAGTAQTTKTTAKVTIPTTTTTATTTTENETTSALKPTVPAALTLESVEQLSPKQQQQQLQQQQQSSQTERNLCDITPSTEAKTVETPNETCVQNNNNHNSNSNNNHNNAHGHNNSNNNVNNHKPSTTTTNPGAEIPPSGIFEVTAEESDCINGGAASGSRPLDVNKNAKVGDDFEDTHSTDSAFESASEGDISRHLPDEFSRLSVSLESTRLDDLTKEMGIETGTIATESTECLVAEEAGTPSSTPTPSTTTTTAATAATATLTFAPDVKDDEVFAAPRPSPCPSPTPTPPPPSTSPGGVSSGLRRTETSCAYLNQSTRNRSQSSDSLCSENSLDGSTSSEHQFAEKLTKNDTLSRRQLVDGTAEAANRPPSGLKALTLWSNNLTKDCGRSIAELLQKTVSLELLNIGKNCLSNDFVATIKDSLTKNTTLTTLGLQSAHLSAKGIETLASILTFGGNSKLQRIDIRDNKLEVESLNIIADVLKSNKTITQIDINDEPKRLTIGSDAHLDYTRVLGTVRSMCSRNEKIQAELLAERTANVGGGGNCSSNGSGINNRCRGGYYLGSRKISLTCHSRPLVDAVTGTVTGPLAVTAMPTPAAKLEVKRKSNARLRSPGPSPPTVSPSSSPNRSRFHVSRVNEVSPLTSPLVAMPPQHPPTPRSASSCMSIPAATSTGGSLLGSQSSLNAMASLPTSSSLPAMASATSSTQTIKRLSASPRSRFQVQRIYEDPQVPLASRQMPPITPQTPPIILPPTPMLKSTRKAAQLAEAASTTSSATSTQKAAVAPTPTTVVIVEPSQDAHHDANSTNDVDETAVTKKLSPHFTNSPTSSSSCSTSPVSLTSNSNSSPSPSSSSSSTSASASSTSNDVTDSFNVECTTTVPKSCPIAVFGDNDITLTKDSAAGAVLTAASVVQSSQPADADVEVPVAVPVTAEIVNLPPTRSRKTSWIANQSAVDKLLTLFHTTAIFQRSSSPETKTNAPTTNNEQNTTTSTTTTIITTATTNTTTGGGLGFTDVNVQASNTLVATRKTTPPAWTPLDANVSNAGATSFLDTASRQLRDFGKQVFRQNLSFNQSGDAGNNGAAVLEPIATSTSVTTGTITSISSEAANTNELNAAHIPMNLKRELKENISPEHTINEETLHTLQKLARSEDVTLRAEAAAELGDIEIVMHSELDDCLTEGAQEDAAAVGPAVASPPASVATPQI
ncbi:mucin-5AC [Scaptodrosophila lebanonensis]|uniref:Mucin-5AC n=1 Tax=Drosophila lebanonensis TaxID=7225 RepID=A0A6J2TMU5_DROLE|nr:mucin-5AC [Scaptodrosophila lebanonensis]XP_030377353.1 mucin-5AC [Scaptodrosophila lebanonensis]XP_030377354.1 mucin-5AC [Scaptodrosophila lebanonensis]